jgi:hypothetical protein
MFAKLYLKFYFLQHQNKMSSRNKPSYARVGYLFHSMGTAEIII